MRLESIMTGLHRAYLSRLYIYYSYETAIAYIYKGETIVRVNDRGVRSGWHLNYIDGGTKEAKAKRITGDEFEDRLRAILEGSMS